MLVIGLVCIVVGVLLGVGILVTIGIILAIIGACLLVLGSVGHPVGGRKYWYQRASPGDGD